MIYNVYIKTEILFVCLCHLQTKRKKTSLPSAIYRQQLGLMTSSQRGWWVKIPKKYRSNSKIYYLLFISLSHAFLHIYSFFFLEYLWSTVSAFLHINNSNLRIDLFGLYFASSYIQCSSGLYSNFIIQPRHVISLFQHEFCDASLVHTIELLLTQRFERSIVNHC